MMTIYPLRDHSGACRYIGITSSPTFRQQEHKFILLMHGLTKREASELEVALIKKLNENRLQLLNIRA